MEAAIREWVRQARRLRTGVILFADPPEARLGRRQSAGEPDFDFARHVPETTASSCLFVPDSGEENVLA